MNLDNLKTLDDVDVAAQRILVRADLNVPVHGGQVSDDTRLARVVPGLIALAARGARVIVLSHFGRPTGQRDPAMSLRPVADRLRALAGRDVAFADDCIGETAQTAVGALADGGILVLENLRFHAGEEANDPAFVAALAELGDLYVNDAFSAAHRAHASTAGLAASLPKFAGPLLMEEINALRAALDKPERPTVAVVGGAKVSSKIPVLTNLVSKVDNLIIGGGMANTFLLAQGWPVGASLAEPDQRDVARDILARAQTAGCNIVLPADVVVAQKFEAGAPSRTSAVADVGETDMILDVGPGAVAHMSELLGGCRTLLWNGPLGAFEIAPFGAGTFGLAKRAAELTAAGGLASIAGGGDTVAALNAAGVTDQFTYVSSAGGAFLEWLEGRELPGVAALT